MSEWTIYGSLIIPQGDDARVLLLPSPQGWALPQFTLTRMYIDLHLLQRAIRARYGAEMTVLRWIENREDEAQKTVHGLWLMENHTPDWTPPEGARWIDGAELAALPLADEAQRAPLLRTLDELAQPEPATRLPWMRRGWFKEAQAWTRQTLEALGYTLSSEAEQFKTFSISALLRTETTQGLLFFKVAIDLPLFCHEPKMMQTLGALLPEHIPAPLAIDETRRWMLSSDYGTMIRGSTPDPSAEMLTEIVRAYAALQIATSSLHETLFAAGCFDRRLPTLMRQIDELLADEEGQAALADEDERARWIACGPALHALCERLAQYRIPDTLVHGDFHGGNVTRRADGGFYFFDWTDACIAHPFFDLPTFLEFDAPEQTAALRDAYLACWTDYEPLERLREAYEIAEVVAALHQAVSYQSIRRNGDPELRGDWDWSLVHWPRSILKGLERLAADAPQG